VARTATLVQEVGDTTAAEVCILLSATACLVCIHTAVRDCPVDLATSTSAKWFVAARSARKMMFMLLCSQKPHKLLSWYMSST